MSRSLAHEDREPIFSISSGKHGNVLVRAQACEQRDGQTPQIDQARGSSLAVRRDTYCEHGQPRFLCRLGCNGNDRSRPVLASSPVDQVIPDGDERVKVADEAIFATLAVVEPGRIARQNR